MPIQRRKDSKNRVLKEGEYERPNGTFEFRWRDKTGKRHAVYGKTLKELREKELDVTKDIIDGINTDKSKMTVRDLYCKWVTLKRGIRDNTFEHYKYLYEHYVTDSFNSLRLCDIRKSDIKLFYNELADKNLSATTIENVHQIMRQVFDIGVEDGYIRSNPTEGTTREIRKKKAEQEKKRALTIEEQKVFEEFLSRPRERKWQAIFTIMLYTGMRVGEIISLRWCDIDLDKSIITVNHTLSSYPTASDDRKLVTINVPKTKSGERVIPMLPIVKEMFLSEKNFQNEIGLTCTSVIDGYTDFIFLSKNGLIQKKDNLNNVLLRIVKSCNKEQAKKGGVLLPHIHCHILRHTFATRMCEAGLNIKAIQEILGHTDISTTMNIYTDATKELKISEMNKLDKFFEEH